MASAIQLPEVLYKVSVKNTGGGQTKPCAVEPLCVE